MAPSEYDGFELLVSELGRIHSELTAQRRLSAEVAHDLATPAQVVLGLSELLLDDVDLRDDVRVRIEQIGRTARTLASLVDELRTGLGIGDDTTLTRERLDLAEFVGSVVDRARLLSSTKNIDVTLDSALTDVTWVEADGPQLERALVNVLGNAIKFSPARSTVTVRLSTSGAFANVAVVDEGPGISDDGQARIFDVYHREADTAHVPGHGLGLHIARQIMQSHGGDLAVDSEPGSGATFALHLPVSAPATT